MVLYTHFVIPAIFWNPGSQKSDLTVGLDSGLKTAGMTGWVGTGLSVPHRDLPLFSLLTVPVIHHDRGAKIKDKSE